MVIMHTNAVVRGESERHVKLMRVMSKHSRKGHFVQHPPLPCLLGTRRAAGDVVFGDSNEWTSKVCGGEHPASYSGDNNHSPTAALDA